MMIPFSPTLTVFYGLCAISGFAGGSLDTGGNVLCLDIWQGLDDAGPWMHSIHFAFGLGAFISPLVSEKFLMTKNTNTTSTLLLPDNEINQENISNVNHMVYPVSGIKVLYPILGIFTIFVSFGYLLFAIKDLKTHCKKKIESFNYKEPLKEAKSNANNYIIIGLILVFLFLYAGMELMYATYLTTFSVQSDLHLSRQMGARVTSTFWGSFAFMRFLAIFVAVRVSPVGTLVFSFFLSVVGCTLLAVFGETSTQALFILTAFMGVGMAPIYASSMLWMDKFMTVTNKIGGLMSVAASIGADSFPLFLGQFIADFPMLLMYMQVGVIYLCIVLFSLASWIGLRRGR